MDRSELYDRMADRKFKPKDLEPYDGGNGRVNKCVDLMKRHFIRTGGILLDIGGGIGDLGHATREMFDQRIVLDISRKNLEAAKVKGNDCLLADIDRGGIPLADNSVDLVTALDFIEHIVDPENFARECARVLKPSGEVFINTPNIRFWRHINHLWIEGKFPHTSGDREVYHGGHLAFYTFLDLHEIFGNAGFTSTPQFKDEECYENPPDEFLRALQPPVNQAHYARNCLELGCPNLLYKAIVRK